MPVLVDIKADIIITPLITLTEDDRITLKGARIVFLIKKAKFSDLNANEKEKLKLLKEI